MGDTLIKPFKEKAKSCKLQATSLENELIKDVHRVTIKIDVARIISIITFFLLSTLICDAQVPGQMDTTNTVELDTLPAFKGKRVVTIESYSKRFDPRKALLYSAVFPGAGQAYNNKYWKLPLVYGGFWAGLYVVSFYQQEYTKYKNLLFDMLNDPTIKTKSSYTEDQLRQLVNTNRRQRDYFSALTVLWYVLQIVDAHVDAHLKEFDLNPQLQVRIEPSIERNPFIGKSTGLSLKFRF